MPVTFDTTKDGATEARLSDTEADFLPIANWIESEFRVKWTEKLNGLDQSYWDFLVDGVLLTLHREHYLGVSLFPSHSDGNQGNADALVREIAVRFGSSPHVAGIKSELVRGTGLEAATCYIASAVLFRVGLQAGEL
jgi:hypothetical protein